MNLARSKDGRLAARKRDALSAERRALPWLRVEKLDVAPPAGPV